MDYKYLKNSRNMKAFFKGAQAKEIRMILDNLENMYTVLKEKEEREAREKESRERFLSGVLSSLDENNYTLEDLLAIKKEQQRKASKYHIEARYQYVDLDGVICFWSGQGKIPKALKAVMQRDGITDKSHYLIKEEQATKEHDTSPYGQKDGNTTTEEKKPEEHKTQDITKEEELF